MFQEPECFTSQMGQKEPRRKSFLRAYGVKTRALFSAHYE